MTSTIAQALKDAKIAAIQQVIDPIVTEAVDLAGPDATATALIKAAVAITNPSIAAAILKVHAPD